MPGYAMLYRSFEHGRIRDVCEAIGKSTMNKSYQRQLRVQLVSQTMRNFAGTFVMLQEARHAADYDPVMVWTQSDVFDVIDATESAMSALDAAAPDELVDIFALMMVKTRV